ncbi:hypothetical protein B0H14DRAFT_3526262 [Mycena olivaceomarginata]|nr:hypothetical protein B0H14DRAFT_3526262 [Mycena olivaceomarginata]
MDPIYLQDSLGNQLTPIWSVRDSVRLCSILALPTSVAPKIIRYKDSAPHLLDKSTPSATIRDLDFATQAVWYLDKQHWLGWIPTGEPRPSPYETDTVLDLLGICFSRAPAPTTDVFYDAYDSDHQISPVERVAGCHLDSEWVQEVSYLGDRLEAISRSLADTSEFYSRGPGTNRVGDTPNPVDVAALEVVFSNVEEAQGAATQAKRGLLSLLGFLSWMLSVVQLKDTKLSSGDQQYLMQLRLSDRPKTGAVFNLTRDQHEINFPHWANNGVPFHYVWTEEEARNKRFLRFSPEYYEEDLPSYHLWKDDLTGSDWIGQNLRAGKMGIEEDRFSPSMRYGIVDRHLYGARPLVNRTTIRVYAERFKALIRETERETVCTFFRNNPIHQDEPAYGRQPLRHKFALSDFASEDIGEPVTEQARHYESNTVVREQVKNLYAPRRDRPFNSFNGGPALSLPGGATSFPRGRSRGQSRHGGATRQVEPPTIGPSASISRRSSRPSSRASRVEPDIQGSWARSIAGLRRRSSRSLSPPRREGKGSRRQARSLSSVRSGESDEDNAWFQEEFRSAAGSEAGSHSDDDAMMREETYGDKQDNPLLSAPLDSMSSWATKYQTSEAAVDALAAWAPSVMEYDPKKPAYDPLSWNAEWLEKAFLVVDDPRTLARLKTLCALFPAELDNIQAVLEYAMRFGMQFELCTKMKDAGDFRNHQLSSLAINTLPSRNSASTWARSTNFCRKPNATAFIAKGGICKFVAELFAPDLAYRFVRGPSEQVSEFGKGRTSRLMIDGQSTLCIADQVTDVEIAILLGHVKGKNSEQERSLWPSQALLEQHSLHVRGYISSGAHTLLEYLGNRILVEKIFDWRTKNEWKAYLRGGAKGEYAPSVVPTKADFDEGWRILDASFPVDWQHAPVAKIVLPEKFNPHAYRI